MSTQRRIATASAPGAAARWRLLRVLLCALAVVFLATACPASNEGDGSVGDAAPPDEATDAEDDSATDVGETDDTGFDPNAESASDSRAEADGGLNEEDPTEANDDEINIDPGQPLPPGFDGAITLMAIGDSITMGRSDRPSWRYPFQNLAREVNCPVDMVGSEDRWADGVPTGGFSGFDHDHQAVGGRTTLQSAQAVIPLAPAFQPEVALIHTGTNDITKDVPLETAEGELRRIIRALREARPDVTVFLAEIIPAGPALAGETQQWNQTVAALASDFDSPDSPVVTVDMFSGWDHQTMTVSEDNIHPNQRGAELLANRWMQALQAQGIC